MFESLPFSRKKSASAGKSQGSHQAPLEGPEFNPAGIDKAQVDTVSELTVPLFAKRHGLTEDEVWRRLRSGELLARAERGKVLVLSAEATSEQGLPPLPGSESLSPTMPMRAGASSEAQSQEMALLLDHLSLAKEENREILRLTQDAMRRITDLSDALVKMKDSLIEAQNAQIAALHEQLATRDNKITQLNAEKEDLETLARALAPGAGL